MREMINEKIEGQEITAPVPTPIGQISDLMAALKASLNVAPVAPASATLPKAPEAPVRRSSKRKAS